MVIEKDLLRLKLIDPDFRSYINWRGIENVLGIPKDRLKNTLHQYKGYSFTDDDALKLRELFQRTSIHFSSSRSIKEKMMETDYRRILNWAGIETGLEIRKHRLKNVLIGKYQTFTEEEVNKIETFMKNLAMHFYIKSDEV